MDHLGHGLALDHPIYRHPEPATFEWIERPRPEQYAGFTSPLYPDGVGETYRLTRFETDKPEDPNPTLVSHEGFFTDIPGFENLAEGNSAKALGSLSLARQGRYFYWGYSIDPQRMTDGAKATLVNVLYYMRQKKGSETVPFVCKTRASLQVYTWLGRHRDKPYMRGVEQHLPNSIVPALRSEYTRTFEGADAFLAKYLEFLYAGKGGAPKTRYGHLFDVDRDAMALGTPNAERASLERWIDLAGGDDGEDKARAKRCLARYVHPDIFPKNGKWKTWYRKHRSRLCFIESTGFWWQLDPTKRPAVRSAR